MQGFDRFANIPRGEIIKVMSRNNKFEGGSSLEEIARIIADHTGSENELNEKIKDYYSNFIEVTFRYDVNGYHHNSIFNPKTGKTEQVNVSFVQFRVREDLAEDFIVEFLNKNENWHTHGIQGNRENDNTTGYLSLLFGGHSNRKHVQLTYPWQKR